MLSTLPWEGPAPRSLDDCAAISRGLYARGLVPLRNGEPSDASRADSPEQARVNYWGGFVRRGLHAIGCESYILRAPTRWSSNLSGGVGIPVDWTPGWAAEFAMLVNDHLRDPDMRFAEVGVDQLRQVFLLLSESVETQTALRAASALSVRGGSSFLLALAESYR